MAASVRRRQALLAGGVAIAALLAFLLLPGERPPQPSSAGLMPREERPPAAAPPPPPPVTAAPTPDASQLRLLGILATGAIVGTADGSQRFVPVGRDVLPGLALRRVELHHAILASAAGEVRLGLDGVARSDPSPGPAQGAAAPAPSAQAALRDETLRYRIGLAPRRAGGRMAGFTVRRGASMPALERAGLRPGDVIVAVNGSAFDEERMLELAWQIANSSRTEFEVERGGRRLRMALDGR